MMCWSRRSRCPCAAFMCVFDGLARLLSVPSREQLVICPSAYGGDSLRIADVKLARRQTVCMTSNGRHFPTLRYHSTNAKPILWPTPAWGNASMAILPCTVSLVCCRSQRLGRATSVHWQGRRLPRADQGS